MVLTETVGYKKSVAFLYERLGEDMKWWTVAYNRGVTGRWVEVTETGKTGEMISKAGLIYHPMSSSWQQTKRMDTEGRGWNRSRIMCIACLCVGVKCELTYALETGKIPNPARKNRTATNFCQEPNRTEPESKCHGSYSVLSQNEIVCTLAHCTINEAFYFT